MLCGAAFGNITWLFCSMLVMSIGATTWSCQWQVALVVNLKVRILKFDLLYFWHAHTLPTLLVHEMGAKCLKASWNFQLISWQIINAKFLMIHSEFNWLLDIASVSWQVFQILKFSPLDSPRARLAIGSSTWQRLNFNYYGILSHYSTNIQDQWLVIVI